MGFGTYLLSMMAAQTLGAVSPELTSAIRAYAACIETKMLELEPSKAPIDEIFQAAKTQCSGVWVESYTAIKNDFERLGPAPSGRTSQSMSIEMLEDTATGSKDRARVAILRKRAGLPPINTSTL